MSARCGFCDAELAGLDALVAHMRAEHPDELRRLESENGPLAEQIAAAPVLDEPRPDA